MRLAKHCRFHFNHFVKLAVKSVVDGVAKVRDCVLARTGKELVLPRQPGQPEMNQVQYDDSTRKQIPLKPMTSLGPSVIIDDKCGKFGRVSPIRWNPLEGSSNGPAQVSIRGNMDQHLQSILGLQCQWAEVDANSHEYLMILDHEKSMPNQQLKNQKTCV